MTVNYKETIARALLGICHTRDYVGEHFLPPLRGWSWYDTGLELAELIPGTEAASEFFSRVAKYRREDPDPGVRGPASTEKELHDALEAAWGIIANAHGGDWLLANGDWQRAAVRWRDNYHTLLPEPGKSNGQLEKAESSAI